MVLAQLMIFESVVWCGAGRGGGGAVWGGVGWGGRISPREWGGEVWGGVGWGGVVGGILDVRLGFERRVWYGEVDLHTKLVDEVVVSPEQGTSFAEDSTGLADLALPCDGNAFRKLPRFGQMSVGWGAIWTNMSAWRELK